MEPLLSFPLDPPWDSGGPQNETCRQVMEALLTTPLLIPWMTLHQVLGWYNTVLHESLYICSCSSHPRSHGALDVLGWEQL